MTSVAPVPDISVVIATYRRPLLLARCLDALCEQSLHGDRYEIIVADDDAGRDDGAATRAIVASYHALTGGSPVVRYVAVTRTQGPAGARNTGWRTSDARLIAFTDDDTVPGRDWLAFGIAALASGFDALGGAIVMPLPDRPTDYERDAAGLSKAEFATANCFVKRAALAAVGGFDERFTAAWREDSDLHFALMEAGYRVGRSALAIVVHPVRPAPFGVSLSQQRKVMFDVLLFKKHRALYRARILSSPPWNYYLSVAALAVAVVAAATAARPVAIVGLAVWAVLTLRFARRRLQGASRRVSHVIEMLWTSMAIPPLALWWRLVGIVRFRTMYL